MIGDAEWTADHLVVWSNSPGTIEVSVDGVHQQSGSAIIPIPDGLTKKMLNIVFAGQPAARLAGRLFEEAAPESWWRGARHYLRL